VEETINAYSISVVKLRDKDTVREAHTWMGVNGKMSFDFLLTVHLSLILVINRLTPNDPYMSRTAPLTSKHCILYIYSTNVSTEYFKHALYSPFFSLQNAVCFIMLTCLVPVLFTFYIQDVLKLKKIIPAPKA
jgi:hypothetical protein